MKLVLGKSANNVDNQRIINAYKKVFISEHGNIVIDHLTTLSGLFEVNYEQANSHRQSFYEGRRSLMLEIMQMIEHDNNLVNYEGK